MFAEISLHFTNEINREHFSAGMPTSTDHQIALSQTVFSTTPELATSAVYSRVMPSTVYIVFEDGTRSLKVHVENTIDRGSIAKLKGAAEEVLRTLSDAAMKSACTCDDAVIRIHAENNLMQEGRQQTFRQRIIERLRDTIIGDFLVGAATAVTGLILGVDLKSSIVTGLAVVFALFVWLLIEAGYAAARYKYDDV